MTGNATVYIFYHNELNGSFYRKGILDGLEDHNFSGTIKMAAIDTRQDLDAALNNWFGNGDDGASSINEIVTHSSILAEDILQRYYLEGYTDADSGTGIRAFSTPSGENQTRSAAPSLEEALDEEYERYLTPLRSCVHRYRFFEWRGHFRGTDHKWLLCVVLRIWPRLCKICESLKEAVDFSSLWR